MFFTWAERSWRIICREDQFRRESREPISGCREDMMHGQSEASYQIIKQVGKGAYGVAYIVAHKASGQQGSTGPPELQGATGIPSGAPDLEQPAAPQCAG
ncbi:hypothetical protein HaLaN_21898, partial [Haematococcus lacustris]